MQKLTFFIVFIGFLVGCQNEKLLISDTARLNDIEKMLKVQKELTANSLLPIWSILDNPSSKNEEQALRFVYAYMPLSDLADTKPGFVLANIRQSLLARKEMTWGSRIPEEEFLHFVLPMRVNNENLDSFRLVYYDELKARVKGLTMKEAALEVNHWCHEKVNYRGTDSRTSAPMSTISKTFGRCGEESTFTVAAMRTVGIPARQVYTPRWAHTDDNHAWVEVWIDGSWHYMGACEPDADLDMGWFSEPSQRTMLVHTRTFGRYFGPEEVINAEERFSELNLTATYAKTKRVTILVSDPDGKAIAGAKVEFKLYNYAEFYPLTTTSTDQNGIAKFTTGLGNLLVWASKDGKFTYKDLVVSTTDTLRLVLNSNMVEAHTEIYDLVPPSAYKPISSVSEQQKKNNDKRLANEDSIRNETLSSFKDSAWIRTYAKSHEMNEDSTMRIVTLSYGNWKEIIAYLENNKSKDRKQIFPLTYGISAKDLSDTKAFILTDHLQQSQANAKPEEAVSDLFVKYVLAPRIDLEILSPWRSFLWKNLDPDLAYASKKDINTLINWINTAIRIDSSANKHSRAPLTPIGVYNLRVADPLSRDIFFVAVCRTFGIPARLNPETHIPEYRKNETWYRALFGQQNAQAEMGKLILKDGGNSISPQYSIHFTIARIQNGNCHTLEFEEGKKLSDFSNPLLLETGNYLLVTGRRLSDASVLSSMTFFEVTKEKPTTLEVSLRNQVSTLKPVGQLDPGMIHVADPATNMEETLTDLMQNENSIIVLLDPDSEPSKHILNDLTPYIDQFNRWKGHILFVNVAEKTGKSTIFQNYKLPVNTSFSTDAKNELAKLLTAIFGKESKSNLPCVIFCQPAGEIMLISSGYKIGIGEQLMQIIKRIEINDKAKFPSSCTTP